MKTQLYIRNMVCGRCIKAVTEILCDLGMHHDRVLLGEVQVHGEIAAELLTRLSERLKAEGFELIDDKKSQLIDKVKKLILNLVRNTELEDKKIIISEYIGKNTGMDYSYVSGLFSAIEGQTIEYYFISQKIELAKELLVYNELTLSEISYKLGYSSVAHLSNQFKRVTGLTPSHFRQIGAEKRKPLDQV
ncbi:MAG: AraC family transcriptional regulator [Ignavibacteriaceae bacterium]|nr:AraC family transcriptional regulator [Ignavibacteriaceae bacterium]